MSDENTCPKRSLYRTVTRHAQLRGVTKRRIEVTIGIFLKKYVGPELRHDQKKEYVVSETG